MDQSENSIMRKSQIRPPSRIPSPGKPLFEISESEGNVRTRLPSKLPATISKSASSIRLGSDLEPKRKTLAERAGEIPVKSGIATGVRRSPRLKGTSLVGARNNSFATSTSSRITSRNASNSSFSSSVGPGSRLRPQSSMTFSQSVSGRSTSSTSLKRPASSMDDHMDDGGLGPDGKRKGMESSSFISPQQPTTQAFQSLRYRKLRGTQSTYNLGTLAEGHAFRDVSISTALRKLQLDDLESSSLSRTSEASSIATRDTTGSSGQSDHAGAQRPRLDPKSSALVLFLEPRRSLVASCSPSQIPIRSKPEIALATPATPSKTNKTSPVKTPFLTKDSNVTGFTAWDVRGRLEDVEAMYSALKDTMTGTTLERNGLEEAVAHYKARLVDLETTKALLESKVAALQSDLDITRQRLTSAMTTLDDDRRAHRIEMDDLARERRNEVDQLRRDMTEENERLIRVHNEKLRECRHEIDQTRREMSDEIERSTKAHREEIYELERRRNVDIEEERRMRTQEVQEVRSQIAVEQQNLDVAVGSKEKEIQNMRAQLEELRAELAREQTLKTNLQKNLDDSISTSTSFKCEVQKLEAHVEFLKSDVKGQSDKFLDLERELEQARESEKQAWDATETIRAKLIKEESIRRSLFNQVQELKGNIRVMCRVRPISTSEVSDVAQITYPDTDKESKELEIQGPEEKSSLGNITRKNNAFSFDRVFGPSSENEEVFEEISQLVQSALDGYNVCIFCYGQTGAGKTYTMSSADGMIPRATKQIYDTATKLQEKGWAYTMEGNFIEVYNEDIHDLLGNPREFDKKKHEIRHDEAKKQTTVTGLKSVTLESADTVESILKQAAANRSVAATKSNERSSRSHSVFILKLIGKNSTTNETSEGTLNLVDLAGSERLKISGAEGDRMRETQNINKSLSCLGDVIGALGAGKEGNHIPYRNSKLTYLLQYSLGGNSKTLMFVMISPEERHLRETLTSLKFATKVHNTHIGTAKKSTRVREQGI